MLKQIGVNLWSVSRQIKLGPGLRFPARMTVVRLADGGLVLISPLRIEAELKAALEGLGPVRYLFGPNKFHYLFLKQAGEVFPQARIFGAPGLAEKRPGIGFHGVLRESSVRELGLEEDLQIKLVDGAPAMNEAVFLHRPSHSLIVTDLVFNIQKPSGFALRLLLKLAGVSGKLAQSRAWRLIIKDRALAGTSMNTILEWEFQQIVPAHGDVVVGGNRELAKCLSRWLPAE